PCRRNAHGTVELRVLWVVCDELCEREMDLAWVPPIDHHQVDPLAPWIATPLSREGPASTRRSSKSGHIMRRKSRMVWGLSGLLALALVVGLAQFLRYGQRTGAFTILWSPVSSWRTWSVSKSALVLDGRDEIAEIYDLGFVLIWVPHHICVPHHQ